MIIVIGCICLDAVAFGMNCKKGAFNEWSPAGAYMEVAMVAAVATGKRHNQSETGFKQNSTMVIN